MTNSIEPYLSCFQTRYNHDISVYDDTFLQNIINDRRRELGMVTDREYLNYLESRTEEAAVFRSRLTNSYSEFFRNPLTFAYLEQVVLPQLIEKKRIRKENEIRIWSAGSASGQEPYSLAILFDDFKCSRSSDFCYRIFATDNSVDELNIARKGVFGFQTVKNTKLKFAEKYFGRSGDEYVMDETLKKQVDFSEYDLLDKDSSSPPSGIYGDFDLIMCCNVLFYYQPEVQQMILRKFHRSLKQGGIFITGEAETHLVSSSGCFRQYAAPAAIFVKK